MPQRSQAHDPRTRLALACSALARAGQALSTTTSPEQTRKVLVDVAAQLESDRNLGELIPVDEITLQCRELAKTTDEAGLLAACRRIATSLARRASSLAAEVQQKAAVGSAGAFASSARSSQPDDGVEAGGRTADIPAKSPPPPEAAVVSQAPEEPAAAAAAAPGPAVPPKPPIEPTRVAQVSIAASEAEREAVAAALEVGRRFARVQGITVIDVEGNRMWLARPQPGMTHAAAVEAVDRLDTAGYRDWRLPSASELRVLFEGQGGEVLRSLGILPAMSSPLLRTDEVQARFLGLMKKVVVFDTGTGTLLRRRLKDATVQTLAVRSS
jgi:hypothetical protein